MLGHGAPGLFAGRAELDQKYGVILLESHSRFGTSPFTLGVSHPRAPRSLCHFIMKKLADVVPTERWCQNNSR
jgi:hypothetical protein